MKTNKKTGDMSLYDASEFWDEHDFGEFEDVKEVKEVHFAFKKKKYIPVDMMLYKKIKQKAKRLGKTEDTLVSEWLKEKVE